MSLVPLSPQEPSLTRLWPNDSAADTWQFVWVGGTCAPVKSVFAGPMTDPKAFSSSPAPMLAATEAVLSMTVEFTSPTVPAARMPPP
jgi:hypothetical protein